MNKSIRYVLLLGCLYAAVQTNAQWKTDNIMSAYYSNQMLSNAAYTGVTGNRLDVFQNRSWAGFDNAPVTTGITGAMRFGSNSAIGAQFISDQAGALTNTYGLLNYSYRIKLTEEQQLRLGIALSLYGTRLNSKAFETGGIDPSVTSGLNTSTSFDANIGAVYELNRFDIGLSFFNIGNNLQGNNEMANLPVTQLSFMYKWEIGGDERLLLSPLGMLRLYKSTQSVADFGARFDYDHGFNAMILYQTSGSIRGSAGYSLPNLGEVNFYYSTNNRVSNSASQQYELSFGFYFKTKKK